MNDKASNHGLDYWAKLGGAIALVQLAFWLLIQPPLFGPVDHADKTFLSSENHRKAEVADLDPETVAAATFIPLEQLPASDCCAPGYRLFRFDLSLDQVPADGLGVAYGIEADNAEIWVNGTLVFGRGRMELPNNTYHANLRSLERIPAGVLREGKNTIEYRMVRNTIPWFDFIPPALGPYQSFTEGLGWRAFVIGDLPRFYMWTGMLLSAFLLVLLVNARSKTFIASLFVLVVVWTLRSHFHFWSDPPFGGLARSAYYFTLNAAFPFAWLAFVDQWTGRPLPRLWQACLVAAAAAACFIIARLSIDQGLATFEQMDLLLGWIVKTVMSLAVLRLGWHLFHHRDTRYFEVAIFVLFALLVVLEFAFRSIQYLPGTQPLLIAALVIAFFSRSIRLFRSEQQINEELAGQLATSKAELSAFYEKEAEAERQRALIEERKRIMRDMHDGLGSRLFGIAAQLRQKGDEDSVHAADSVLEVIDELRLIVDSLDTAGDDLAIALGAFRARVASKLEDAGIGLVWQIEDRAADARLSSGEILDLFRFLQEAFANAMRHSRAAHLSLSLTADGDDLKICVIDDGQGFDTSQRTGMGLRNLEIRAQRLGGKLSIDSEKGRTQVVLLIPSRIAEPI